MSVEPVVPVLILSGTVGVGKSTILDEVHDLLVRARIPHVCLDTDALAMSWPARGDFNQITMLDNVATVWANARAAGATRVVIASVVERRGDREAFRRAIPGAEIVVCQLVAPMNVRRSRLRQRERGAGLEWHLKRTEELQVILDTAAIHDFVVSNDQRTVQEVAGEVLMRADWPGLGS
ncbi:MAG: adenylyl-sulfate kinase [bacterium]